MFLFFYTFCLTLAPLDNLSIFSHFISSIPQEQNDDEIDDTTLLSPEHFFDKKDIIRWVSQGLSYDTLCCFVQSGCTDIIRYVTPEQKTLVQSNWTSFINRLINCQWTPGFLKNLNQSNNTSSSCEQLHEKLAQNETTVPLDDRNSSLKQEESIFPHKVLAQLTLYTQQNTPEAHKWVPLLNSVNQLVKRINDNNKEVGISPDEVEREKFYNQIIKSLDNFSTIIFELKEKNETKFQEELEFFCNFISSFNDACPQRLAHIPSILYLKKIIKKMEGQIHSQVGMTHFISQMLPLYVEHLLGAISGSVLIKETRYFQDRAFRGIHAQESYKYYAQELGFPLTNRRIKDPLAVLIDEDTKGLQKVNQSIHSFLTTHLTFANLIIECVLPCLLQYDSNCAIDSEPSYQQSAQLGASVMSHQPTRNNGIVDELKRFLNWDSYLLTIQITENFMLSLPDLDTWFKCECLPSGQNAIIQQAISDVNEGSLWTQIMENHVLPDYIVQKGVDYFINNPDCHSQKNSQGHFFLFHLAHMALDVEFKKKALLQIFKNIPHISCYDPEEGHTLLSVIVRSPFINNEECTILIDFVLKDLCNPKHPQVQKSFWDPSDLKNPYVLDGYCQNILVSILENRLVQHHHMVLNHMKRLQTNPLNRDYYRYTNRSNERTVYSDIIMILLGQNYFCHARPLDSLQYIFNHPDQFTSLFQTQNDFSLSKIYRSTDIDDEKLGKLINEFYPLYYQQHSTKKTLDWIQQSNDIFFYIAKNNDATILGVLLSFLEKNITHFPNEILSICEGFFYSNHPNQWNFMHIVGHRNYFQCLDKYCQFIKTLCFNTKTQIKGLELLRRLFTTPNQSRLKSSSIHWIAQKGNVECFDKIFQLLSEICLNPLTRKEGFKISEDILSSRCEGSLYFNPLHLIIQYQHFESFKSFCLFIQNLCLNKTTRINGFKMLKNFLFSRSFDENNYTVFHQLIIIQNIRLLKQFFQLMDTFCSNNETKDLALNLLEEVFSARDFSSRRCTFLHLLVMYKNTINSGKHLKIWHQFINNLLYNKHTRQKVIDLLQKTFFLTETSSNCSFSQLIFQKKFTSLWNQTISFVGRIDYLYSTQFKKAVYSTIEKIFYLPQEQVLLYDSLIKNKNHPTHFFDLLEKSKDIWNTSFDQRSSFLSWKKYYWYGKTGPSLMRIIFTFHDKSQIPTWLIKLFIFDNVSIRAYIKKEDFLLWGFILTNMAEELSSQVCLTEEQEQIKINLQQQGFHTNTVPLTPKQIHTHHQLTQNFHLLTPNQYNPSKFFDVLLETEQQWNQPCVNLYAFFTFKPLHWDEEEDRNLIETIFSVYDKSLIPDWFISILLLNDNLTLKYVTEDQIPLWEARLQNFVEQLENKTPKTLEEQKKQTTLIKIAYRSLGNPTSLFC